MAVQKLTDMELELMNVLWRISCGTVHDVLENLPEDRPLAYTSVSTVLRILEQKNILLSEKSGRSHIYIPRMTKKDYESYSVQNVIESVFDNAPTAFVKRFIETVELSQSDIANIQQMLRERETPQ